MVLLVMQHVQSGCYEPKYHQRLTITSPTTHMEDAEVEAYSKLFYKEHILPLVKAEIDRKDNMTHSECLTIVKNITQKQWELECADFSIAKKVDEYIKKDKKMKEKLPVKEEKDFTPDDYLWCVSSLSFCTLPHSFYPKSY